MNVEDEILNIDSVTHIFLQAGVGSFAGGITAALVNSFKDQNPFMIKFPKIIVVEAAGAHCLYLSHQNGDGDFIGKFQKSK